MGNSSEYGKHCLIFLVFKLLSVSLTGQHMVKWFGILQTMADGSNFYHLYRQSLFRMCFNIPVAEVSTCRKLVNVAFV